MSVNSPYFWLAFAPFLLLYRRFATEPARGSHLWILGFSAAFLCLRSPWTLVAITLLGAAVFYGALHIESLQPGSAVRRRWAGGLILLCLAVLVGSRLPSVWNVMGASFFVFQLIAYVADVASGANRAEGDFGSYLSSIGCFAYLTAGPIVRLPQLLPQLRGPEVVDYSGSAEAVFRIVNGLAKKTAADLLTYPVNDYFAQLGTQGAQGSLEAWTALLALGAQYYADFSGYSDIALGIGALLGLRLPENFRTPYFAASVLEHWKRSHISLSYWAHDYLFIPLCLGNWGRGLGIRISAPLKMAAALTVTLVFIGLWHGFGPNFFAWGIFNAALILLAHQLRRFAWPGWSASRVLKVAVTFYLILLGRVFLRTSGLDEVWLTWKDLHSFASGASRRPDAPLVLGLVVVALIVPHLLDQLYLSRKELFRGRWLGWAVALLLLTFAMVFNTPGRAFLYEGF